MHMLEKNLRTALACDYTATVILWALGTIGMLGPLGIFVYLLFNGISAIDWVFLSQAPKGFPLGQSGGILPAIKGSLALVGIGLLFAMPLAVSGAIYMTEYGRNLTWLKVVRFSTECLASIPAIVYGLFGYAFLVVYMALKVSLLAGGITLGFVMLPIILIGAEEAMRAVRFEEREAALALGVTRTHVARRIVLRRAWPGILAVMILAAGHALGTAAPILYTASVILSPVDLSLSAPVMTLPTHLYYLVSEAVSMEQAYGTALILMFTLLIVNCLAMYLQYRLRIR
ncbi:MAG: phosphate ABC transporter, permease protein PstA [Magnetovibrio sp.]|nr:phosphate ABC transporter, permease protein PstA [Magnetovibrio sp.]